MSKIKDGIIGHAIEDADTVGAVAGSTVGIIYGYDSIPKDWLNKLVKRTYLEELSNKFEEVLMEEENE